MKKNYVKGFLMAIVIIVFHSCIKDSIGERNYYKPTNNGFEIEQAQDFFNLKASSMRTKLSSNDLLLMPGEITPLWKKAKYASDKSGNVAVNIGFISDYSYKAILKSDAEDKGVNVFQKLIVTKAAGSGEKECLIVTLIPMGENNVGKGSVDEKFVVNGDKSGYTGIAIYSLLNGRVVKFECYKAGKNIFENKASIDHTRVESILSDEYGITGMSFSRHKNIITRFGDECVSTHCFDALCVFDFLCGHWACQCSCAYNDFTLSNPYSLSNMQSATDLYYSEQGGQSITLESTHIYVRFLPTDSTKMSILNNLGLALYTYPLDRQLTDEEIEQHQSYFVDDALWHYTTVPVGFAFPTEIQYEILDDIYMQENPSYGSSTRSSTVAQLDEETFERVFEKSMEITGNETEFSTPQTRSGEWYPKARIRYEDDVTKEIMPVKNVMVRVHHFVNVGTKYTDEKGETGDIQGWGGRFKYDVRYKIIWTDGKNWQFRDGGTGPLGTALDAKTHGPKSHNTWDKLIDTADIKHSNFAHLHMACRHLFYDNPHNVTLPRYLDITIHNSKNNNGNSGEFNPMSLGGILADIKLWRIVNHIPLKAGSMVSTLFHELGHASHYRASKDIFGDYLLADNGLKETYARCFQYIHFIDFYSPLIGLDYPIGYQGSYQDFRALFTSGFTQKQLEQTIRTEGTLRGWGEKLKTLNIIDGEFIDLIFANPGRYNDVDFRNPIMGDDMVYPNGKPFTYRVSDNLQKDNDIQVVRWYLEPTILAQVTSDVDTNNEFYLKFNGLGMVRLCLDIRLPSGKTITYKKDIEVKQKAYLTGNQNPYVGVAATYTLNDFSGKVNEWKVTKGSTTLSADADYKILSKTDNSVTLMLLKHHTGIKLTATAYNTTESMDGISVAENNEAIKYNYYRASSWPNDTWMTNTTNALMITTAAGPKTLMMKRDYNFYGLKNTSTAYSLRPLREIDCGNNRLGYTTFGSIGTVKMYIFTTQIAGTVPLYEVEHARYENKNLVYSVKYVTRENVMNNKDVTSWYWNWLGTKKIADRDWDMTTNLGVVGYVLP